jgi:hypothetical protein
MRTALLVAIFVAVFGACGSDGATLREGVCYVDDLPCGTSCPTFDEAAAELRATPCMPYPGAASIGTCGPYHYVEVASGFGGRRSLFDASGKLVRESVDNDTPISTPCDGEAFSVVYGMSVTCETVATEHPCFQGQ